MFTVVVDAGLIRDQILNLLLAARDTVRSYRYRGATEIR
jgi:hypothetical protein